MESWSYVSEGKGFVSDESISAPDVSGRGKNGPVGWEFKDPCGHGSATAIENQGFVELGFAETMRKSWPVSNPVQDVSSCRTVGERIFTPITSTTNAFSVEEESSSKFSSSVVESNGRDSSLIDLKLGRFADQRDAQNFKSSKATPTLSSAESSAPAKRIRAGLNSQTPFCQVHGCKKDLSSCKDYHKRHKVCEDHSKTSKVIVNGIEQRFCQQCSRFHLLAEFDAGKRSCRKRLAGHNERRRRPHGGNHTGRTGRLFQPYIGSAGSRFHGNTLTTSCFICQDIHPSNLLNRQENGMNDWCRCVKLEDAANYSLQSTLPITNGHPHPKSMFPRVFEKQCLPFHGVNSVTGRDFNENINQNPHNFGASKSVTGSLIPNTSIGNEDLVLFDSASTVQGLSGMSASGRALSLLSSQSQNSSSHSSGLPVGQSLIMSGTHDHYCASQAGKLWGAIPQPLTSGISRKFHSTGTNSMEENHFGPILIPDDGDAVNFAIGVLQGSQYLNGKDHHSCDDGPTIDLLQLSSQLQRVEHQRQSMQVKQENDALCGLKIT